MTLAILISRRFCSFVLQMMINVRMVVVSAVPKLTHNEASSR